MSISPLMSCEFPEKHSKDILNTSSKMDKKRDLTKEVTFKLLKNTLTISSKNGWKGIGVKPKSPFIVVLMILILYGQFF